MRELLAAKRRNRVVSDVQSLPKDERMSQELRDALEQQVEEWRNGYEIYKRAIDPETDIRANMLEQCADDIEELLQESEDE